MQRYIAIRLRPTLHSSSLDIGDDHEGWQHKAQALRSRREQLLKQRLRHHTLKSL